MNYLHMDAVGITIDLETEVDLSATTTLTIRAVDPDGQEVTLTAAVQDTTKARHVKTASTLDEPGTWTLQVYAEWGGGTVVAWGQPWTLRVDG